MSNDFGDAVSPLYQAELEELKGRKWYKKYWKEHTRTELIQIGICHTEQWVRPRSWSSRICEVCGKEACGHWSDDGRDTVCSACEDDRFREEHDLFWGSLGGKFLLWYSILGWSGVIPLGLMFGWGLLQPIYCLFWYVCAGLILKAEDTSLDRFRVGY